MENKTELIEFIDILLPRGYSILRNGIKKTLPIELPLKGYVEIIVDNISEYGFLLTDEEIFKTKTIDNYLPPVVAEVFIKIKYDINRSINSDKFLLVFTESLYGPAYGPAFKGIKTDDCQAYVYMNTIPECERTVYWVSCAWGVIPQE